MEALFALSSVVIALIGLAAASVTFGVDSRDSFGDDRRHPTFG